MSLFFGCIAIHSNINISEIASQMTNSMSLFKEDVIGIYQTPEVFICNKFLFNTPESVNIANICQNEKYVLAATCRIDNREELATKIQIENPLQASDHEYILAAYTYYQEQCVKHLIGDFSFVVWDKHNQTLFMAKDHLGIKPLFYYQDTNFLLFSTSIHTIKSVKGANLDLDMLYIARELKSFSPTFEDTFFKYIKRLKPAHFIKFIRQQQLLNEQKYWELTPCDISNFKTDEEIYDELRRLLNQSIVCRTRTNKNIGCQLSGGLDSSAIAVLLSQNIEKTRLHTYSFVLSEKTRPYSKRGIDEQETQNIIIEYAGLKSENHHKIEGFHFKDVFEELEISNLIMGGYSSSDCSWQDTMFKKSEQDKVGVIMSGFLGDECLSNDGSLYYFDYLGNIEGKKIFKYILEKRLNGLRMIVKYYLAQCRGTYNLDYQNNLKKRNLLHPSSEYNKNLKKDISAFKFYPTFKEYLNHQICRPHTCHRSESEGLYALQYGIEVVYPLGDIRLIKFAYSVPPEMYKPLNLSRTLFRNICKPFLPKSILQQKKYNGAMTLAFAEYWKQMQITSFQDVSLKDPFALYYLSQIKTNDDLENIKSQIKLHKIDKMINYNNNT